jgi:Fe-S-cluster containining protein
MIKRVSRRVMMSLPKKYEKEKKRVSSEEQVSALPMVSGPIYAEGLRFKCTECGKCCTGGPGAVWMTRTEIIRMAEYLELEMFEFARRYLRKIGGRFSLKESGPEYDCVFLEGKRCTVYPVRPVQCRTFPWWPNNISSPKGWAAAAAECEGISPDAPVVPREEIEKQLQIYREESNER